MSPEADPQTPATPTEPGQPAASPATPELGALASDPPADDRLAEGGRKALERERQARKDAERQARESAERVRDLEQDQMRRDVAADLSLTAEQADLLVGATADELRAHAERLRAAFGTDAHSGSDVRRTPRERLRPGAVPNATPADSARQIAEDLMRS